jgi:hypothetical protein
LIDERDSLIGGSGGRMSVAAASVSTMTSQQPPEQSGQEPERKLTAFQRLTRGRAVDLRVV